MVERGQGCQWDQMVPKRHPRGVPGRQAGKGACLQLGQIQELCPQEDTPLMLTPALLFLNGRRSPPRAWVGTELSLPPPPCRAGSTCQRKHTHTITLHLLSYFLLWPQGAANWPQRAGSLPHPHSVALQNALNLSTPSPRSPQGWHIFQKYQNNYYQRHNHRATHPYPD